MAFDREKFQPIGGQSKRGRAPQMWSYQTTEANTDVDAAGYFNNVSDIVKIGDVIIVQQVNNADTPTSWTAGGFHVVNANASGVVDVANVLAFTATDSD